MGETIREHLFTEEARQCDKIQRALKAKDRGPYEEWLGRRENHGLRRALRILETGASKRLYWDSTRYTLVDKKEKAKVGPSIFSFLKRTDTVIQFTDGFSFRRSQTHGGHINGAWEEGEMAAIGGGKEKYKVRKRNVIWI